MDVLFNEDQAIRILANQPPLFPIRELGLLPHRRRNPITLKDLEIGDIILSTSDHDISKAVRNSTGSMVSHAALYIGAGRMVQAANPELGVQSVQVSTAVNADKFAVVYRMRGLTPKDKEAIKRFAEDQVAARKPYDKETVEENLRKVFKCKAKHVETYHACMIDGMVVREAVEAEKAFTCSELVFAAFKHAGKPLGDLSPEASAPGSVVELNGKLDYVGHLK